MSSFACRPTTMRHFLSSVLLALLSEAVEQATLSCYGDGFKEIVGGNREATDVTFTCPSCVNSELCSRSGGQEVCFRLTTNNVIVFQTGEITQSLQLPTECLPLRIVSWSIDYEEYIVQCESAAPQYQPKRLLLYHDGNQFSLDGLITDQALDPFTEIADNNVLLIVDDGLYIVALLNNSNQLFIHHSEDDRVAIPGCRTITRLHAGPSVGFNLSLVVDCISTESETIRQWVLIPSNRYEDLIIQPLHPPLPNDGVSFSPEGSYVLYKGTSELMVIQTEQLNGLPVARQYNGPIADTKFLPNHQLLITIPEQNQEVIDLRQSFDTGHDAGHTILQNSAVSCSQGLCPPSVYSDRLFLFTYSSDPSYMVLVSYNISDSAAGSTRIAKVLAESVFDTCFLTKADIPILPLPQPNPPITPTNQPSTEPSTLKPTQPYGDSGGLAPIQSSSNSPVILGSIFGTVLAVFGILILIIIITYASIRSRSRHDIEQNKRHIHHQETDSSFPTCSKQYVYPQFGNGSAGTSTNPSTVPSTNPSSAPSLEFLNKNAQVEIVTPNQETKGKVQTLPPDQILKRGAVKLEQMV